MPKYLVTGASSGLGAGLVRELVRRGNQVWGVARRGERLLSLREELGDGFRYSVCDVGRAEDVRAVVQELDENRFDPATIILNAAINPERRRDTFSLEEFEHVIRVNVAGTLIWIEVFLPRYLHRRSGQFVAISSLAAYRGDSRWVAYGASKAAVSRAFEALRGRHASMGIRFTTIYLGAIDTGMGSQSRSPFRLSEQRAVKCVLKATARGVDHVTVPRHLRFVMECLRILPDRAFSGLINRAFGGGSTLDGAGRSSTNGKHTDTR